MAKKFALVLGLHNLFNIVDSVYDVSSIKSIASGLVDLDSVAYIIADATDGPVSSGSQAHPVLTYKSVKIGNMTNTTPINVGDAFIWTRGKIYSGNTLAGGGGAPIDWNVAGDDWIDADFTSNNDGSVTVTINHINSATGTAVSSSGTAEVNGTSTSGGVDVITGFKLDSNGHVTDVTRTKIYATPVTINKTTGGTDGTYISDVSLSGQELTFNKKTNGVFTYDGTGTGTVAGKIITSTTTMNKVEAGYSVDKQGSATGSQLTNDDTHIPTSKAVLAAINDIVVPTMEFKGTTYTLPSSPGEGDMYKIVLPDPEDPQLATTITITATKSADGLEHTVKNGDTIIANANGLWWVIPSGDDIEDTWRSLKVNGAAWKGSGLNTGDVNFKNGTLIEISPNQDNLTISHAEVTKTDTANTDTLTNGDTFTAVTGLVEDYYGHITEIETTTYTLPTISPGDGVLTVTAQTGSANTGSERLFSANQPTNTNSTLNVKGNNVINAAVSEKAGSVEVEIGHNELTATEKIAVAPSDPSTEETTAAVVISGITVNDYGHVTSVSKKKIPAVNNATLTVTGNDLNKTIVIYADSASMPSSGGSAASFTANDDTAATYHVDYTGASDATDWTTIGYSQS